MPADSDGLKPVFHPTDLSAASQPAFEHALKIALCARAPLRLFHVDESEPEHARWNAYPGVRQALIRWGLLPQGSDRAAVSEKLGLVVSKVSAQGSDPIATARAYLSRHPAELVVLATHGARGPVRLPRESLTERLARRAGVPTLFVPPHGRGFVSSSDGALTLRRILIPVDREPAPAAAIEVALALLERLSAKPELVSLLHVASSPGAPLPALPPGELPWQRAVRQGHPVEQILLAAEESAADLIVMATRGRQGFLDGLRGNTSERVVHRAPCPVLTVPVA